MYLTSNAQNINTSPSLNDSILKYSNTDIDKLIFYSKKIQQTNNFCDKIAGAISEAKGFYQKKDYNTSEKLVTKVLAFNSFNLKENEKICLKRNKISAYNRLFWIELNRENYKEAYKYVLSAETINESFITKSYFYFRYKLNIQSSKALIKSKLHLFNEAKVILIKTYSEIDKIPFSDSISYNSILIQKANISNSLADNYLNLSREKSNNSLIDSADIYFKNAFEISKKFKPKHTDSEINYYLKKTEVLIAQKKYSDAIKLINQYSIINKNYNYHHFQNFQKAICFYNLKESDSTLFYSNLFLDQKDEKCKRSKLITIYDIISNQYYNLNKIDSAYKYSKLTLKEFNSAKNNEEKTFQLLYNNDFEKTKELNKTIKEKGTKSNSTLYFLLISSLIPIIFFFIVFNKKDKKNTRKSDINDSVTVKKNYNIDARLELKIEQKLKTIEENKEFLHPDFSIKFLAETLNTNTSYLSYFFNKNKKSSFKVYYSNIKINYLIHKLKTDKVYRKYTIETLGNEIGYTNPSAFTRAFKKHTGTTPSTFIKSLKD